MYNVNSFRTRNAADIFLVDTITGSTGTMDTTGTGVPGTPNTGDGGMTPINLAVLAATGAVAVIGAAYVLEARKRNR